MYSLHRVPSSFQKIFFEFRHIFNKGSFENFIILVKGWLLCLGRRTISEAIVASGDSGMSKQFSTFYYFFSKAAWEAQELGESLFLLLQPWLKKKVVVAIDDTLCEKTGPHFFGGGIHHDAHKSTYGKFTNAGRRFAFAFGWNFVVLAVYVQLPWNRKKGVAIPILATLYRSKKTCPEDVYKKRTLIAAEQLQCLAYWIDIYELDLKVSVTGDSEYSCRTVARALPNGWKFTGRMPNDAAIYDRPVHEKRRGRRRKKGDRMPCPRDVMTDETIPWVLTQVDIYGTQVAMNVKTFVGMWYRVTGTRLVRVVITQDPKGRLEERVYFSTDPSLTVSEILTTFSYRWSIEVTFRNVKQHLGLNDPQNGWGKAERKPGEKKKPGPNPRGDRGAKAVERTIPFIFSVYGLLHLWYFEHGSPAEDVALVRRLRPWYRHKTEPSFEDVLNAARSEWGKEFRQDPLRHCLERNSQGRFFNGNSDGRITMSCSKL